MKKKTTLLKSLLVAAAMIAGVSGAWAQTVTTYDFEDGKALFTEDSRITASVVEGTQTIYSNDFTLDGKAVRFTGAGNAQNGYSFAHYDFSALCNQAAKVKVEFDCVLGNGARSIISVGDASVRGNTGNSSKTTYSNKGAIFRIGTDKNYSYINEKNVGNAGTVSQKWLKVTVEVDETAKTYTYSVVNKSTSEELYKNEGDAIAFYNGDATNCTQIDMFGYINSSQMGLIDNLIITVTKDERPQADYTVKFVDELGANIKDPVTRSGAVGDDISLILGDNAPLWNGEKTQKYMYKSDDAEGKKIASDGSTVVTIVFREAETYYAILNCKTEDDAQLAQLTGSFFEGESYNIYPARGYSKGGVYYFSPATSYNGITYKFPGSIESEIIDGKTTFVGTLTYTEDNTVAYYSDIERLALPVEDAGNGTGLGQLVGSADSWWSFSGGIFDRFSQGRGVRLNAESYIYTEPITASGVYRVIIYGRNDKSSEYATPYELGLRDAEGNVTWFNSLSIPSWAKANTGSNTVENVIIPAGSSLVIGYSGDRNEISFDDITLKKTGDIETAIVTSAGWATFVPTANVTIPDGVEAYYVSAVSTTATLTQVETAIPAGAPVLLKAAAGTYTFTQAASAAAIDGNLLKISDGEAMNVLVLYNGDKGVGFYNWSDELPKGKVYLDVPAPGRDFIGLSFGEATGINAVESAKENGAVYNLAGQRVAQPTRGLYIVNGKKVIVK